MYAMLLSRAGADIACVCRSNYEPALSRGFTVHSTLFGNQTFKPRVAKSVQEAVDNQASSVPFDFIVVCVKAVDTGVSPAEMIKPAVRESHTSIVVIQNGLGVEAIYHQAFPRNTVISGVTYMPTSQVEPCVVSHSETQTLFLGPYPTELTTPADKSSTEAFSQLIVAAGANATVCDDIQVERWKKLIGNTTWNPVCALSRCRDLQFLHATPDIAQGFITESMREVVAVASTLGYGDVIREDAVQAQIQRSKTRQWPGVQPSMLADIENDRPVEVEAVIGEVVRIARKHQVSVPRLETLYVLLKGYDYHLRAKQI
ncbi:hypothetical protein ACJQWK_02800 [Exserohilum turcicum]